jgi:citronellol/citronellal dehydrogenase
MTLEGKTLFISGGSRGIGLAIAIRAARDGANVALIAKTAEPHPQLEGTVYTGGRPVRRPRLRSFRASPSGVGSVPR